MIGLQAQSLASYAEVIEDGMSKTASINASTIDDARIMTKRERIISAEESTVLSLERYLNGLIWNETSPSTVENTPREYDYIDEHLAKLKNEFGDDPYFFDRYYHPEAQYLTGCHIGRTGMPIIETQKLSNGKEVAILSCRTEHASVYYTTDGRTPDKNGELYSSPIIMEPGMILQAKAIRDDLEHSPILHWEDDSFARVENKERLNEDKIMGIFPIPNTAQVLVKFKTKNAGEIAISLIDMNRKVHHIDFIQAEEAKFGQHHVDVSRVPMGAYLIKFKFESGRTTYRQMTKG